MRIHVFVAFLGLALSFPLYFFKTILNTMPKAIQVSDFPLEMWISPYRVHITGLETMPQSLSITKSAKAASL